jgi:hypothetical protein
MRMGNDNLLQLELRLSQDLQDILDLIAGIDDHGFAGLLIADDRAVALQRPDWEDSVEHIFSEIPSATEGSL